MNRKSSISFGPGASSLILIFVVLAMSVLGMLNLMNSRSDVKLSERSAQVAEAVYALNAQAEEKAAQLDDMLKTAAKDASDDEAYLSRVQQALPEDVTWADGMLCFTVSDGFRTLNCQLKMNPLSDAQRCQWAKHSLTAETEEGWEND